MVLEAYVSTDENGYAEFGTHGWPPLSVSNLWLDDPNGSIRCEAEGGDGKIVVEGAAAHSHLKVRFSIPA